MINKIKEWIFFKYGVNVSLTQVWMIIFSVVILMLSIWILATNNSKKTMMPDSSKLETGPNLAPRLRK